APVLGVVVGEDEQVAGGGAAPGGVVGAGHRVGPGGVGQAQQDGVPAGRGGDGVAGEGEFRAELPGRGGCGGDVGECVGADLGAAGGGPGGGWWLTREPTWKKVAWARCRARTSRMRGVQTGSGPSSKVRAMVRAGVA